MLIKQTNYQSTGLIFNKSSLLQTTCIEQLFNFTNILPSFDQQDETYSMSRAQRTSSRLYAVKSYLT